MKIFYDTEFIDDGRTIEFISIGMVREDGQELYAVTDSAETVLRAYNRKTPDGYWLRDNVVKHLPYLVSGEAVFLDEHHPDRACVLPREAIADKVRRFIIETPNPQLWAWYAAYDHIVYAQLFGAMQDLPGGVPMYTNDLKQEHVRIGSPRLPRQSGGEHNALADARHNQVMSRFMENILLGHA